jgi:hypothetical protein
MEAESKNYVMGLLESGYVDAAQHALEDILKANPRDLQAWSIYVKSWKATDKRIKALELCLKYNPGNPEVQRALTSLKSKVQGGAQPPAPAPTPQPAPAPVPAPRQVTPPPQPAPKPVSAPRPVTPPPPQPKAPERDDQVPAWLAGLGTTAAAAAQSPSNPVPFPPPETPDQDDQVPAWLAGLNASDAAAERYSSEPPLASSKLPEQEKPIPPPWAPGVSSRDTYGTPVRLSKEEIEQQAREYVDGRSTSKRVEKTGPMAWYEVWFTALTRPTVDAYDSLLRDPNARPSRSVIWLISAGLITGLIGALTFQLNPQVDQALALLEANGQFSSLTQSLGILMLCLVPVSGVMNLIGAAIGIGIVHLVADLFGGKGSYSELLYLYAAYSAPVTILSVVLGIIPFVGGCLALPLGLYNIYLYVLAIRSAHKLDALRAIGIIVSIALFFIVFTLVAGWLLSSTLTSLLPNPSSFPTY